MSELVTYAGRVLASPSPLPHSSIPWRYARRWRVSRPSLETALAALRRAVGAPDGWYLYISVDS